VKRLKLSAVLTIGLFCASASAETHVFVCKGTQSGPTFAKDHVQFEFKLDAEKLSVDGPMVYIGYCGLMSSKLNLPEPKTYEELKKRVELHQYKCRLNESEVSCGCSNGYWYKTSNLTFSRYSGLLDILTIVRGDRLLHGQFLCSKSSNEKLF